MTESDDARRRRELAKELGATKFVHLTQKCDVWLELDGKEQRVPLKVWNALLLERGKVERLEAALQDMVDYHGEGYCEDCDHRKCVKRRQAYQNAQELAYPSVTERSKS